MTDTLQRDQHVEKKASYTRILRNRPLLLLWLGQLVSRSGDYVFDVAVVWLVLKMTGSALNVGLTVGTSALPSVLIAPIAGVYVDRINRRRLLLVSNAVQAAICLAIALSYSLGDVSFPILLLLLFALNAAGQFAGGAVSAMLPRIVPPTDLAAANGLFTMGSSFNQLLGYGLGGIAILALGIDVPVLYDALTFVFALSMIWLIPAAYGSAVREGEPVAMPRPFLESFVEGLSYIRGNRVLLEIVALAISINFFGGSVGALIAPYAEKVLGGNASAYGFLLAAFSLGSIAGALAVGKVNVREHVGSILFGGLAATGALVILFGMASVTWAALVISVVMGFFEAAINLPIQVLVQVKIPGNILGRTIGTLGALVSLTVPLAAFVSGGLASMLPLPLTYQLLGALILITSTVTFTQLTNLRSASY